MIQGDIKTLHVKSGKDWVRCTYHGDFWLVSWTPLVPNGTMYPQHIYCRDYDSAKNAFTERCRCLARDRRRLA